MSGVRTDERGENRRTNGGHLLARQMVKGPAEGPLSDSMPRTIADATS